MHHSVDLLEIPGPHPPPVGRVLSIIVADDDQADVLLLVKALKQGGQPVRLLRAKNGDELLHFLRDMRRESAVDLVLLDLNMPRISGHEALAHIRSDARLRTLPVVVLTTSKSREDVDASYRAGANGYISKNPDYTRFANDIANLVSFWGNTAELPSQGV